MILNVGFACVVREWALQVVIIGRPLGAHHRDFAAPSVGVFFSEQVSLQSVPLANNLLAFE